MFSPIIFLLFVFVNITLCLTFQTIGITAFFNISIVFGVISALILIFISNVKGLGTIFKVIIYSFVAYGIAVYFDVHVFFGFVILALAAVISSTVALVLTTNFKA